MENNKQSSKVGQAYNIVLSFLGRAKSGMRKFKSFLIVVLAALAIYQTSQLWFVNLANRNFFLFFSDRNISSLTDRHREFVRPMRLIYGAGDGRFTIDYSGLMELSPRDYVDSVLTELFDSGTFVGESETDFIRLLSRPVLIYEYAFPMPGDIFSRVFNQRAGIFLASWGLIEFTSVVVWPPYTNHQSLRVFFINDDRMWEFAMDSVADGFSFPVHSVSGEFFHFVSAALEGYEHLPPSTFVARTGARGNFPSYPVIVTNPYVSHVGPNMHFTRTQVAGFFDNPATINARIGGDGIWTFSNIHTTVRYFYTHVLEYVNFRPRRHNVNTSILEDFSAALAFIENDRHVINEIFLTGFEPRGVGYVFWFGYIVDNFPVLMPGGWAVSSPYDILPAPIEVVVEHGRVEHYRRLAYNFHLRDGHYWMSLNLDAFLEGLEGTIDGLTLGYYVHSGGNLQLDWWAWILEDDEIEEYEASGTGG